jgi:hypothetical protein
MCASPMLARTVRLLSTYDKKKKKMMMTRKVRYRG